MKAVLSLRWLSLLLLAALPATLLDFDLQCHAGQPKTTRSIVAPLQPFVEKQELAGAVVLVADKEKVLAHEAIGFADVVARLPMMLSSLFWIASQSKPITAAALMILVDEGKIGLDDPVEKYLPEFKGVWLAAEQDQDHVLLKRPKQEMKVRQLLSHTSGQVFRTAMEQPTIDVLPLRDAVRSYTITPLHSEPGTKYLYSNAGINTAGRIIEVVSGQSYEDFLQKRLFDPLGMKDTTFWPNDEQLKRLAKSYKPGPDKKGLQESTITALRYPLSDRTRHPVPGGGLFSTAQDVGTFCQMVLNHGTYRGKRILSEKAVKEMSSKQTGKDIATNYGLGWAIGGDTFGHGGAYATNMTIDTKRGLVTVFMVQHNGFPGAGGKSQAAFRKAAEEAFGK